MQSAQNRGVSIPLIDMLAREMEIWRVLDVRGRQERIALHFGDEPIRRNWCAAFAAYCRERAGMSAPGVGSARRGALALTRWVAKRGQWIVAPDEEIETSDLMTRTQPGDVICWRRGTESWTGHVATITAVADGMLHGIEGNVARSIRSFELSPVQAMDRLSGLHAIARAE